MSAWPESNLQRLLYYQQEKKEKDITKKSLVSISHKNENVSDAKEERVTHVYIHIKSLQTIFQFLNL